MSGGSFQLSPGIRITEKDLTNIVPAVATSPAATAGYAEWGPMMYPSQFSSENQFVAQFGEPNDNTFTPFFTVANFLSYASNMLFTRADSRAAFNASANATADVAGTGTITTVAGSKAVVGVTSNFGTNAIVGDWIISATGAIIGQIASIASTTAATLVDVAAVSVAAATYTVGKRFVVKNQTEYATGNISLTAAGEFVAKYPGAKGNSLAVSMADSATFSKSATGTIAATLDVWVVSLTRLTSLGTAITASPHNLIVGQSFILSGATNGFAGTFVVTAVTNTTTITFASVGADQTITPVTGVRMNSMQLGGTGTAFTTEAPVGSYVVSGSGIVIGQVASIESAVLLTLTGLPAISQAASAGTIRWKFYKEFNSAPSTSPFAANVSGSNDELHVVVWDEDGGFTGVAGTILEKYAYLSKAVNASKPDGGTNYYANAINTASKYVWFANAPTGMSNWGTAAAGVTYTSLTAAINVSLANGTNGDISTEGDLMSAFILYANTELYDVSLIAVGKATYTLANYVIQNIAEVRKDCVAFISPQNINTNAYIVGATSQQTLDLKAYADLITSSSYGFIDSGVKYQYDRYNDVNRWVPLNGDMAGLTARTDYTNDPWWSPAGYNRGQIKNVIKLGFNPSDRTDRDVLYQARINPVVSERGQGVLLMGDKTTLAKPSAFDRINVRRLFIVLEKSIAIAAKYLLFEFNDPNTRNLFIGMVTPFLRDVQGRQGIQSFAVVCDESNNTNEVVSSNNFVGDIYIQPNYSINFITLNFVATRTGAVNFKESGI
jgi:phage tail sheath protein FI